jgi:tellurite methyltransferase
LESDWDRRYRTGLHSSPNEAHDLVRKFVPAMPRQKVVVDIAMGVGTDAMFLARSGLHVIGLEKSSEAIVRARRTAREAGVTLDMIRADAAALPFKIGRTGTILVFNFLQRDLIHELVRMLAPGGIMIYQTFLKRQVGLGLNGPRNPAFLLDDGELISRLMSLELLFYEEGIFGTAERRNALARFVGRKR